MMNRNAYSFHVERARVEFDLGYRAAEGRASRAHLALAALHMARAAAAVAEPAVTPEPTLCSEEA